MIVQIVEVVKVNPENITAPMKAFEDMVIGKRILEIDWNKQRLLLEDDVILYAADYKRLTDSCSAVLVAVDPEVTTKNMEDALRGKRTKQ